MNVPKRLGAVQVENNVGVRDVHRAAVQDLLVLVDQTATAQTIDDRFDIFLRGAIQRSVFLGKVNLALDTLIPSGTVDVEKVFGKLIRLKGISSS